MTKLTAEDKKIVAKYSKFFNNTGGNDIVELIERKGVTFFNNCIVAELQGCCLAQLVLLKTLLKEGLLAEPKVACIRGNPDCPVCKPRKG